MKHTLSTTLAIALGLGIGTLSTTAKQAHADTINNYTVQAGDTLSALAQRYNSDINTIATTNHLSNPNLIFVGQHLVIDSKNNANSSTSSYKAVTAPVKQYPVNNTTATNSNVKTAENGSQANTPHYQYVQAQVPSTMQSNAQQRSWNELSSQEKQAWQQQPQQTNNGSVESYRLHRRMIESTNNYNTQTGNGYIGAYQFAPQTIASIERATGMKWSMNPSVQDKFADYYANERYGGWQNVPTTGGW